MYVAHAGRSKNQGERSAWLLVGALIGGVAVPAFAETPRVDQRQENQDKRIEQGVASGELTRREAARLDAQQDRIENAEERAKADGKVTRKERARLHLRQDKASRDIRREKHDRHDRH